MRLYEAGLPTLRGPRTPNHEAYRHVRKNVFELLSGEPPNTTVPACPDWTVRDLLEHLVGSAALAVGRTSGWPSIRPSTSTGPSLPELLDTWDQLGGEVDALLAERGERAGNLLVTDAFTHELDLRGALGEPPPPDEDHPAFATAFEVLANGFAAAVAEHQLPALRLSTGSTHWTVGVGTPAATITADRVNLYRSIAGRRTVAQITALDWDQDSHRWLPAFTWGPFSPPESPIEEPSAG